MQHSFLHNWINIYLGFPFHQEWNFNLSQIEDFPLLPRVVSTFWGAYEGPGMCLTISSLGEKSMHIRMHIHLSQILLI